MHHPRKPWFWHIAQVQFIQLSSTVDYSHHRKFLSSSTFLLLAIFVEQHCAIELGLFLDTTSISNHVDNVFVDVGCSRIAIENHVGDFEKMDKLDLRDVPKPGLSGVMHYKQACTITDAS